MVMAEYVMRDKLSELWQQINHLHLTYLDTEDSPQKIEQRNKLEACIREYLCLAPHSRKFYCAETAEVLHRSASNKPNFSGYRAALAWNAISMYAGNLLSQPWRNEYRTIKTYSGFYKHQIEANLSGAEAMFQAMGYKYVGNGILLLEGPVCPDRLTNVSQDSIVAFVECQILKTIWEEVGNSFKVSWLEVLEFRESHLCSPEQSIRMLNYRFHERRYQEQQNRNYPPANDSYSTVPKYGVTASNPLVTQAGVAPVSHAHPHLPVNLNQPAPLPHLEHSHLDNYGHVHQHPHSHYAPLGPVGPVGSLPCPAQCIYGNPYFNYSTYAPVVASPFPRYGTLPFPVCAPKPCNGYCYPNGCVPASAYVCPVPTGQLIELEAGHNGLYDAVDGAKRQQEYVESHKQLAKATNLDSLTLSKSREDGAGTFESWDYVYRSLEGQGYSKDLGDRSDILQSDTRKKRDKKTKPSIELEDAFNSLNLSSGTSNTESNLKVTEGIKRFSQETTKAESKVPQSTSCDNITENHKKSISNGISKTKTLPREKVSVVSPEKPSQTLDTRKLRRELDKDKGKGGKERRRESGSWNCHTCTYLNSASVEICVMCGKSKRSVEVSMAVGGSQCPRCTLVNPKECANCQVCDTSLLNSPTYI